MEYNITGRWIKKFGNADKMTIYDTGAGTFTVAVCADSEYEKVTTCSLDDAGKLPAQSLWGPCVLTFTKPGMAVESDDPEKPWQLQSDDWCGTWTSQFGNHDKIVITMAGEGSWRVAVCAGTEHEKRTLCSLDANARLPAQSLWGSVVLTRVEETIAMENEDPNKIWKKEIHDQITHFAKCAELWQIIQLVDIQDAKPVQNTGAVHNEDDLRRSREMCLQAGCGGFVVKGGDFDSEGHETDPPRGFIFRKTQEELRRLAREVPPPGHPKAALPTLWLAPSEFVVDTNFQPGIFPAPAMHIWWKPPNAAQSVNAFACHVRTDEPVECTYYMTCGFHCGYSGLQEHANGKKQFLFSVWNADGYKCEGLQQAEGTASAGCFGGEGCGVGNWVTNETASYVNWRACVTYTFCVRALVEAGGTATVFVCHVFTPEDQTWHLLGAIRRPQPASEGLGQPPLRGLYSFIEEFGGKCGTRKAGCFGPAWVRCEDDSSWMSVVGASTTSTCDVETMPCQRACVCSDGHSVILETGGEALEAPGPYKGPLETREPPPELESLPELAVELFTR